MTMSCCRELVRQGQGKQKRAKLAKLRQHTVNFGALDQKWFYQPEHMSRLQLKQYASFHSKNQGAIDSLTLVSSGSGAETAYLFQITVGKTHSVSSALFRVLDSLPAQVTGVVLCFVVPFEVFNELEWHRQLPDSP